MAEQLANEDKTNVDKARRQTNNPKCMRQIIENTQRWSSARFSCFICWYATHSTAGPYSISKKTKRIIRRPGLPFSESRKYFREGGGNTTPRESASECGEVSQTIKLKTKRLSRLCISMQSEALELDPTPFAPATSPELNLAAGSSKGFWAFQASDMLL